ncbi:hypothetical protein SERLA73DRAFT_175149 [Serpula lacrymans var. lacrymans S7.3]|uniref:Asparagine--tRNA ligase, mitochondrial n=2 Tax=Serpula lacrymans var. lacrymans TaxID=341189 RepID=F8PKR4_SERL3|nr:uncharacterized protein SERLADRAFT_457275 [Serpula lacrymans var. lacrymans S7.9]EGO03611.1 hypothetical protein SERLA73DRAFT_175149 [Serpula lacrymans var. lacrymans S7.3]EGO29481.1 hypothetical protein SERLADRAFT_457275 [Serpula lacrymans var. lacrymans S7.9]
MLFRRLASTSSLPLTIRQLLLSANKCENTSPVQVHGWIKSVRRQKNVAFAVVSDGTFAPGLQAVLSTSKIPKNLTNGASVRLNGTLVKSRGSGQERELQVDTVEVIGECDPETYPIQKQALSVEYLRDNVHLRARTDSVGSMLHLRDSTQRVLHRFFERQGFCYVHTPILTSNDCEGAGETFRISTSISETPPATEEPPEQGFFSKPSYLTVSSQLHLEALSSALSRVYTLSPCFRAERSQTSRHLAEFWMLEAEWAFTSKVGDVCQVVENSLKEVLQQHSPEISILRESGDEQRFRAIEDAGHSSRSWTKITYSDAICELANHNNSFPTFQFQPRWGKALQSEHERWLAEHLIKGPVFVTDYPETLKPFYMRLNDDEKTVACFDLLIPHVGELAGGSLREERLGILDQSLEKHRLDKKEYGWYADLRRFGGAPHGGFGMGFERLISWVSGIENVRECIAMPRWAKRMIL